MAVSSNQKVGELARIAYLALLHAEGELGDEANTIGGGNGRINLAKSVRRYWVCLVRLTTKWISAEPSISSEMKDHWLRTITGTI